MASPPSKTTARPERSRRARPEPAGAACGVAQNKSRRANKKLSAHEQARFLAALARTGNFALACDQIGRSKSGLYKRRARDKRFAIDCDTALVQFRLSQSSPRFRGEVAAAKRLTEGPLLTAPGDLILSPGSLRHPAKVRRAPAGRLTPAGLGAFLKTLAATANVRLAAASVGVAHSSIYRRARVDEAFAKAMREALELGYARLEESLVRAACAWLEDDEEPGPVHSMSAELALRLLAHHRNTARLDDLLADQRRKYDEEAVRERLERKMRALRLLPEE